MVELDVQNLMEIITRLQEQVLNLKARVAELEEDYNYI